MNINDRMVIKTVNCWNESTENTLTTILKNVVFKNERHLSRLLKQIYSGWKKWETWKFSYTSFFYLVGEKFTLACAWCQSRPCFYSSPLKDRKKTKQTWINSCEQGSVQPFSEWSFVLWSLLSRTLVWDLCIYASWWCINRKMARQGVQVCRICHIETNVDKCHKKAKTQE